ncbi:hypothetical protein P154DRAFT_582400 [Amniculicola lignicola CBS 123094]|uniref:Uncharacterized protein n=1 Tax=Amniculicola lignicola CBS 123094 TaxID=1392246 RepID=A0A6A5W892_9PLEO|nr:hypothetical protein P154DRAFT_582400 [Amniculicola lignicola CBS 123094]
MPLQPSSRRNPWDESPQWLADVLNRMRVQLSRQRCQVPLHALGHIVECACRLAARRAAAGGAQPPADSLALRDTSKSFAMHERYNCTLPAGRFRAKATLAATIEFGRGCVHFVVLRVRPEAKLFIAQTRCRGKQKRSSARDRVCAREHGGCWRNCHRRIPRLLGPRCNVSATLTPMGGHGRLTARHAKPQGSVFLPRRPFVVMNKITPPVTALRLGVKGGPCKTPARPSTSSGSHRSPCQA